MEQVMDNSEENYKESEEDSILHCEGYGKGVGLTIGTRVGESGKGWGQRDKKNNKENFGLGREDGTGYG